MHFLKRGVLTVGLLGLASAAQAQFSSTITATNDYDFRGFSQSAKDPAIQASLDYALPKGFALGAWASNVDFDNDADYELDLYASYTGEISETLSWNAGITYYTYPGSDDVGDYPEYYVGLNVGPVGLKQWYSDNFYDLDQSAWYTEANTSVPMPMDFSLLLHAGYSYGDYWDDSGGGELFDYSVGVGYSISNFDLSLKVTGTDASGDQKIRGDVGNNEARVVFAVATTLPWGEE
jgi:uncharacterized protein (TIGR02001 family)